MARVALAVLTLCGVLLAGCVDPDAPSNQPLEDEDGRRVGEAVRLVKVATGLEDPVFVTGPTEGRIYIVEQVGTVRPLEGYGNASSGLRPGELGDVWLDLRDRVRSGGEQGLLGLAFAPDWPDDDRVYAHYTDAEGETVLSSFRGTPDAPVDLASERVLLRVEQPYSNHNGGMLTFGPDGMLYLALGDGGASGDPQKNGLDPKTLLGSILRLDVSGDDGYQVPADNPFADGADGAPEVWVYGLRNPWRFSFDGDTMWIGDVGQNRFEEVDRLLRSEQAGANLGWNAFEGREPFDRSLADEFRGTVVMPVATYGIQNGGHCAVTGGYVYRGHVEALEGLYVFADYCSGWVWGLDEDDEMGLLFESSRSVSSFGIDAAGELFLVDRGGDVLVFTER